MTKTKQLPITLYFRADFVYVGPVRAGYESGDAYRLWIQASAFCIGAWKEGWEPYYKGYPNAEAFFSEWKPADEFSNSSKDIMIMKEMAYLRA